MLDDPSSKTQLRHPKRQSPTSLRAFDPCQRSYAYEYLERPEVEEQTGPTKFLGDAVHAALAELFRLEPCKRDVETAHDLLRHFWARHSGRDQAFLDERDERNYGNQGLDMLSTFCRLRAEELSIRPHAVEDWVRAPLDFGHEVHGKLDRADLIQVPDFEADAPPPGEPRPVVEGLRVTDYKTGACRLDEDELPDERGAQIYALAASRFYGIRVLEVRFLWLPENVARVWRPEREDLRAIEDLLATKIDCIEAEQEWPTRLSGFCNFCAYKRLCPAQKIDLDELRANPSTIF